MLGKLRALFRWLIWVRYESQTYARFNEVLVLTEQDRYGLTLFSPGLRVTVCRPAMEIPAQGRTHAPIENRIVYLGLLSRPPNIEAVEYFLDSVLPLVQPRVPNAAVVIAGRGAPARLLRYQSETIKFLGFVEDLDKLMQEASVVVVPLLSGGGIKIKVLEALARGCAIVSTSIGAEDTGAVHGESILVADDAESFADCVVQVMQDASLRARLGKNARELALDQFGWEPRSREFEQRLVRNSSKDGLPRQRQASGVVL
jgi:glycosyltransferase involved in cell wall biosynthesis